MTDGVHAWPSFEADGTLAEFRDASASESEQITVGIPAGRDALLYAVLLRLSEVELKRQELEDRLVPWLLQMDLNRNAVLEQIAEIKQQLETAKLERNTTWVELDKLVSDILPQLEESRLMAIQARSSGYRTAVKAEQAIVDVRQVEATLEAAVETTSGVIDLLSGQVAVGAERLDGSVEATSDVVELLSGQIAHVTDRLEGSVKTTAGIVKQISGQIVGIKERLNASSVEGMDSQRAVVDLSNQLQQATARAALAEERARVVDKLAAEVAELRGQVQASTEHAREARASAELAKSQAEHSTKATHELRAEVDSKLSQRSEHVTAGDVAYQTRLAEALQKIELEAEREMQESPNEPEGAGPRSFGYVDKYRDRWQQHVDVQAEQRRNRAKGQL